MDGSIVVFDGICNLCNASVSFIIRRDPKALFRFSPLQSDFSQTYLSDRGLNLSGRDTLVLIEGEEVYTESTAALKIAGKLKGFWPAFYLLILVPRPIRDFFYRIIARNRYSWFGRRDHCMVPDPSISDRFIP